jgi:hypothetical protein
MLTLFKISLTKEKISMEKVEMEKKFAFGMQKKQ